MEAVIKTSVFMGVAAVIVWSAIPVFVKSAGDLSSLGTTLVMRFAIASLFFIHIIPRVWRNRNSVSAKLWLAMTVVLGLNFFLQGIAMIYLPVSWYLIIFSLNPVFALLFIGVRFSRRLVAALCVSLCGTFLFIDLSSLSSPQSGFAFACLVGGMVTWVVYTVLAKRFLKSYSSFELTGITQLLALVSCFAIWLITSRSVDVTGVHSFASIVLLGGLTPVAYFCFTACIRELPKFGIVAQYLEPVFGALLGIFIYGESLTPFQIIGSVMIVAGSALIEE